MIPNIKEVKEESQRVYETVKAKEIVLLGEIIEEKIIRASREGAFEITISTRPFYNSVVEGHVESLRKEGYKVHTYGAPLKQMEISWA